MKLVPKCCERRTELWLVSKSFGIVGAILAAATSPSYGQLTFDQSSYVRIDDSNTARQTLASQMITSVTGGQSISFGAVDSDSVSGGGLIGSFDYFSSVLGSGTARYGSLGGKIDTTESATPDFLPSIFGVNISNSGHAAAHGHLGLSFTESGVVSSSTLAIGTPVTLSVTGSLQSLGYFVGRPIAAANNEFIRALYTPSVRDMSVFPFTSADLSMEGNNIQTVSFNTVVGHTLQFYGLLDLLVNAQAGLSDDEVHYYGQVFAGMDASNTAHLFVDGPAGVTVAATSGHDYSVTPGDYNFNGIVDAADYTVWRDRLGGKYTQDDYDVWKNHFGQSHSGSGASVSGGASAAVPEPMTAVSLFIAAASIAAMRIKLFG